MATAAAVKLDVAFLKKAARSRNASEEITAAAARAETLLSDYSAALERKDTSAVASIEAEILALANRTAQITALDPDTSRANKWWPFIGMGVLALVFVALGAFLTYYAQHVGFSRLGTIEGTRPILVIAAIVSTIAFGGALLIGSLFSSDGSFEDRYRHAREIFLVFSGVFGTVIGFYFGAGDGKAGALDVSGNLVGSALVAHVAGGTAPYKVTVTYGPKGCTKMQESKQGWTSFGFDKGKSSLANAKITAVDSKGLQGEFSLNKTKEELVKEEWVAGDDALCDQPDHK